jgi:transcriptional regulator with XRE-family HTH domain
LLFSVIVPAMFSEELKALRTRLGLTQQAMADRLHMERSTYCRLEHKEHPPAHVVERISKEFHVDAWSWLRPEEPATPEPGPRVVHLRNDEAHEDSEERRWRLRALDLLARITDLVEGIVKISGRRGGGGGGVNTNPNCRP